MAIQWVGAHANNYQVGRLGNKISKVVIHWIVGKLAAADATFNDENRIASAHYGVGGTVVHQYVKEEDTAYHCGNLTTNRQSIGIEHEGGPDLPISEATYKSSAQLIADICRRYSIPVDRTHIIKHSEVKPTQCPGTLDIDKLISMVVTILAPVTGTTTIQVDQTKFDDLERCKRIYNDIRAKLNIEDSEALVLGEVDKLVKLEDTIQDKERLIKEQATQMGEIKTKVAELDIKLEKALQVNTEAQKTISEQATSLEKQEKIIVDLGTRVEELKKVQPIEQYSGVDLIRLGINKWLGR